MNNLNEGLIRVPPQLQKDMIDYFVSMFISKLRQESNDGISTKFLYELMNEYDLEFYDIPNNSDMQQVFSYSAKDVPKNYKSKDTRPRKILAIASFTNSNNTAEGSMDPTNSKTNTVVVRMEPYLTDTMVKRMASNPDVIYQVISRIEGVIEHELTHVIQRDYLSKKDSKMDFENNPVDYTTDDGVDYDKYVETEYEKDPVLKSSINDFKTVVDGYRKVAHVSMPKDKVKYVFSYFTDPTNDGSKLRVLWPTQGAVELRHAPLHTPLRLWKEKDPKQWKKAVKYFYDKVRHLV